MLSVCCGNISGLGCFRKCLLPALQKETSYQVVMLRNWCHREWKSDSSYVVPELVLPRREWEFLVDVTPFGQVLQKTLA